MSPSPPDSTLEDTWQDNLALGDEIIRMAAEIDATNKQMLQLLTELNQPRQHEPAGPPFTVSQSGKHRLEAAIHANVFREPPHFKNSSNREIQLRSKR